MRPKTKDLIERTLSPGNNNQGKLLDLQDAVARFVRPGMKLHLTAGIGGPSAAICEIIRQYRGKTPEFTLIQSTVTGHGLNLVHCGLLKKLVCAACIDISASARPSRIVQKALEGKKVDLENWSLCSLQQRLMAGAFGVPFMSTRSVTGSSIAQDNKEAFREIEDPFGSGAKAGIVKALNPDISIVHGCVGDVDGNIILSAPYGEDLWGPLASTGGVLATVEKIVPTNFIRKYASLVKIPAYAVKSISIAPLGVHPFGLANPGIDSFDPYEKDTDFLNDLHNASSKGDTLDVWINSWVMDCATQEHYLSRLGETRIRALKQDALKDLSRIAVPGEVPTLQSEEECTLEEMTLVVVAREIIQSVRTHEHRTILAGAGAGATAAWLAYYRLRADGYEVELITGNGLIGYTPLPGASVLSSEAGVRSAKILTDTVLTQGVFVGGKNNKCLSVLGAGQIDRFGNINSTKTSTGQFLVGSGGANDAMNAQEVIVTLNQSKERFTHELSYITGTGDRVTTVVSSMGVFRKPGSGEELRLEACFPDGGERSIPEKVKEVENSCGWPLAKAPGIEEIMRPTSDELELLRWLVSSTKE